MTRKQTIIGVAAFSLICLGIGIIWTLRTEPPPGNPWWAGKPAKVRVEVWEPGRTMATVGMTLPKKSVDTMMALGVRSTIEVGHRELDFRKHWREVQSLPPGERMKLRDGDATIYVWIETDDVKPPPITPEAVDSTGA